MFLPSTLLIRSSCCVSIEGLLNKRWTVLRSMLNWSASHWFVRPCRRNSSRIRLPMCICIVIAVFLAQTAYREKEIASTSEKQESVNIAYRVLECWRNSYHQQVPSTLLRRRLRNLFAMIVYKAPTLELPNSSKRYVSIICLNICCLAVYV